MPTQLLLGDEAVAQAAIDAGIAGAFSYPGTPATEIFTYLAEGPGRAADVSARWAANEKVAYEEALGMSYAGKRALVSMKHVGLNVAADPFINSALTGVNGGLVLAVADDPGMHSSQNEQDSRIYGELAQIPVFEPSDQQEAYDMTLRAFSFAEEVGLPVMVRLVTRLAHSRANVATRPPASDEVRARGDTRRPKPDDWTLVPSIARGRFRHLLELQERLRHDAEISPFNRLALARSTGVIAVGIGHNYLMEALGGTCELSLLKLNHYPLPTGLLRALVDHCQEILVIEDGYPFVERRLNGLFGLPGKTIRGRLSGALPPSGELTPDLVDMALGGRASRNNMRAAPVVARPPQLCSGCPHADTFRALTKGVAGYEDPILFSDIGCYTLGVLPPYRAVHSCVDMGASIGMAHGAAQAGAHPVVCTIGDSTFSHSGMTPLLGAARSDANMTVLILDNGVVAMTGAQESLTTGDRLLAVLHGLGVPEAHLRRMEPVPHKHEENSALIAEEVAHQGLSVIVAVRACIQVKRKTSARANEQRAARA